MTQNCYRFVRSRRTRLIVAGVSASALGLLAWCFFHPQQLVQGKPLRYWRMRLEAPLDSENRREVCQVFESEGTNAMPLLIAAINARPSLREWASSRLYMRFGDKLPGGSEAIRRHFEQTDLRDSLRIIAMGTLIHLGSSAAPAVPALARILDDPGDPMTGLAMNVLAHIGERAEPAIPALIRVVQREEKDPNLRMQAIDVLGQMRARKAEPYLRSALKDDGVLVRESAEAALKKIGAKP